MTPPELFKARIIWLYLLDLDNAYLLEWTAWAEETILKIDFVPPFWLCELTVAASTQAALSCVRDGVGLEYADFPTVEVDEKSLLFGLLYLSFSRNNEWAKEAWHVMADVGDVVEYVESGDWRRYQRESGVDISGLPLEEITPIIFRPVAAYALRTIRKSLKNLVYVKEFLHRLKESSGYIINQPNVDVITQAELANLTSIIPEQYLPYECGDYFRNGWHEKGFYSEHEQLDLIVRLDETYEIDESNFLVVGRLGVDGIVFGYRKNRLGLWAFYPIEQEFKFMADSVQKLVDGLYSGGLWV